MGPPGEGYPGIICFSRLRAGQKIPIPARLFFLRQPRRGRDVLDKSSMHPGRLPVKLNPADLPGGQAHEAAELSLREAELAADCSEFGGGHHAVLQTGILPPS